MLCTPSSAALATIPASVAIQDLSSLTLTVMSSSSSQRPWLSHVAGCGMYSVSVFLSFQYWMWLSNASKASDCSCGVSFDQAFSATRLDTFLNSQGKCCSCKFKIDPGQSWDLDHIIPRALGGSDDPSNMQVLCRACHRNKTRHHDVPRIAKSKRQKARHLGARRSRAIIPGSRQSPWKRKMDGSVVRRTTK